MPMHWTLKSGFSLAGRIDRTLSTEVKPSFDFGTDEYWMEQALLTAMNAVGWSAPNPSVGCIVVLENRIIAQGFTQAFRHEHAEKMAFNEIEKSGFSLDEISQATVYVTLEPCTHFGFQPPCVDLFLSARVKRVVIGTLDVDQRVAGQGAQKLKDAGIQVSEGVLQSEVQAWHFPFLKSKIASKPIWVAKWAQNQLGYLADKDGNSKWITNERSRAYGHWLRQKYDTILVGAETFLRDQPKLDVRDCAKPHRRNPTRLIFDPKCRLATLKSIDQNVSEQNPLYVYIGSQGALLLPELPGLRWIQFEVSNDEHALVHSFVRAVENTTFERPLQSIFCEGGARLLNLLMRHGIFDAVHRFTGPKNFESTDARHRMDFVPDDQWFLAKKHQFQDDDLQEWVKCF